MRRLSIITFIVLLCASAHSQEKIGNINQYLYDEAYKNIATYVDSTFFDGYYIILFTKKEINEIEHTRDKKLRGRRFEVPVDYENVKTFVSKQEIKNSGLRFVIKNLPRRNKTKLYFKCDADYASLFIKPFNLDSSLLSCSWPPFNSGNKYYTTRQASKYCFKIYEISGWFLNLRVDSDEKRDIMGRNLKYLQPGLNEFNAYFFLRYKTYSNEAKSLEQDICLWKEVKSIFE